MSPGEFLGFWPFYPLKCMEVINLVFIIRSFHGILGRYFAGRNEFPALLFSVMLLGWVGLGLICLELNFDFFYMFETEFHTVFQSDLNLLCNLGWF